MQFLEEMVAKHRASYSGSIALGDSMSDVKMLEMVQQPIAFNPERKLFNYANMAGWKVIIERKNMIYTLEKEDGRYRLAETS